MWRPPDYIRPKAVAIACHDGRLLVVEVLDDSGSVKGWCPPGGGVNFGEKAAETLAREIREELGCGISITGAPMIFENIYTHEGAQGHDVVFAIPVTFDDPSIYMRQRFQICEDNGSVHNIEWVEFARFRSGAETLYPAPLWQALQSLE